MQQVEGLPGGMGVRCKYEGKGAHREIVDVEIFGPLTPSALDLSAPDGRQDRLDYAFCNPILQSEQIARIAIVVIAPDVRASCGVEEANDDPNAFGGLSK